MFRRSAWQSLWVAVLRSPKDQRARQKLRSLILLIARIAYIVGVVIFAFYAAAKESFSVALVQTAFYVALFGGVGLYAWWSERRDARLAEETSPAVPKALKLAIYREAYLLATLLERAGSERALEKEIPSKFEVITRRVLIDRLRDSGMMERLERQFLDLLLAPDGHWTEKEKQLVEQMWEFLAVMGWALGLSELRPLALTPEYKLSLAAQIIEAREPEGLHFLASWDIRPERDQTDEFFVRCWAELISRGEINSENAEEVVKICSEMQAQRGFDDYLVGTQTISELPSETLYLAALRTYRRGEILRQLVEILCGEAPVDDLRGLFIDFLSPLVNEPRIS